jgi:hypothetical protein
MTETEWAVCRDPQKMLEFLRGRTSDRKLRLFAVACSRRRSHLSRDAKVREALDVAERFADGLARDADRSLARKAAQQAAQGRGVTSRPSAPKRERRVASLAYYAAARDAMETAWNTPGLAVEVLIWRAGGYNACDWNAIKAAEWEMLARLLRDTIGNPFKPLTIDPAVFVSQGGTVVRMATAIYNDRRWEAMPLLGDALEDAGCTDQAILDHCRGPGPHTRGCHVVDAILGRS